MKTNIYGPYTFIYNDDDEVTCESLEKFRTFQFKWNSDHCYVTVRWKIPVINIRYCWYPECKFNRELRPDWKEPVVSSIATSAPVYCFLDMSGNNCFTVALSEAISKINWSMGLHEETSEINCEFSFCLRETNGEKKSLLRIYTNKDNVSLPEVLKDVAQWWENECGYLPMPVPNAGKNPFYSTWYSMHQNVSADKIEEQCRIAKQLGMDTIIVDDGWQTDDNHRGYGYTGDWEVATDKFPDFRAHIDKVHALGMKYMIWFSVPFVGFYSKSYEKFKTKLLKVLDNMQCGILDPRYPEVRRYLVDVYRNAVIQWNLDGIKLDFIDSFVYGEDLHEPPYMEGMDFENVELAVIALLDDIKNALLKIRPDLLIEFRQSYTGPAMRMYGNLFRVTDCPCDVLTNRVGMIDLRLLANDSAIHSDMLEWNPEDSTESVVNQILNVIFAVPQISFDLTRLSRKHKEALTFWLSFIRNNKDVLQYGKLAIEAPQNLYPLVMAQKEEKAIIAVYEDGHSICLPKGCSEIIVLNATSKNRVIVAGGCDNYVGRTFLITCYDCYGQKIKCSYEKLNDLQYFEVPVSGMINMCIVADGVSRP